MNVHARCRRCTSEQAVEAAQVVVALPQGPGQLTADLLFTCAACGSSPVHQVPRAIGAALVAQGAASLPAQDVSSLVRPHPESPPVDAAPLTHDDLLDLHEQLVDGSLLRTLLHEER